jgi:hypothetical protein
METSGSGDALLVFLLQVLWFMLPVVLAGLIHVGIIKSGWFAGLARMPLDGGLSLWGRRLFGDNKTVRGAVIMIGATTIFSLLLAQISDVHSRLAVADYQIAYPALWGALLGAGYILGELPNSFIKRQLCIAPGAAAPGAMMRVFWAIDQVDSAIGVFLVLAIKWRPDTLFVICVLVLALLLHPLVAVLMVLLGLKARVG